MGDFGKKQPLLPTVINKKLWKLLTGNMPWKKNKMFSVIVEIYIIPICFGSYLNLLYLQLISILQSWS